MGWDIQREKTLEIRKDYPKDKFVFFEFHNDETALLEHFLNWIEDNRSDVVYGWNIKNYDNNIKK